MDRTEPSPTVERLRDAFHLLANETRLDILHALWNAPGWTATFTELKEAVGMRDSGQFQYHLNELSGTFIRRTDEGYTHLAGGIALYRAMLGSIADPETLDPIPLDEPCPTCGGTLRMEYENQAFYARCPACDGTVLSSPFLPAGLENRTNEQRLRAFDKWTRRLVGLLSDGVCPWCAGTVSHETTLDAGDEPLPTAYITHTCDRCGGFLRTTVGETVLDHPAVVSFFHEGGVDIASIPHWELDFCTANAEVDVVAEGPVEVRLTVRNDGDVLTLRVDEDANVSGIRRSPATDGE